MVLNAKTSEPTEWLEIRPYRKSWYGYTEDFKKYKNIPFNLSPALFNTHDMIGWRMYFSQKYSKSRMYLHFSNKKNFGFRVRLRKKTYMGIADIFETCYTDVIDDVNIFSSEDSVVYNHETKNNWHIKPMPVNNSIITMESVLKQERERILTSIGDYRGSKIEYPDNVIDFSEYLKEPVPLEPTEIVMEKLLSSLG